MEREPLPDDPPLEVDLTEDDAAPEEPEFSPADRRWEAGCRGCVLGAWLALVLAPAVAILGGMSAQAWSDGNRVAAGLGAFILLATTAVVGAIAVVPKSELKPRGQLIRRRLGARPATAADLFRRQIPAGPSAVRGLTAPPAPLGQAEHVELCGYCQTNIEVGRRRVLCPTCAIPYHPDCWRENGGCGVYGCNSGPK